MARDHRKLEAFHLADSLVLAVYEVTALLPPDERYGLQSQLRRAAVSASTNIVEGCAREGEAEYLRFLEIASGSSREVAYLLGLAVRLNYLAERASTSLIDQANHVSASLISLRRSIRPGSSTSLRDVR